MRVAIVLAASATLAGCGQTDGGDAAGNASVNAPAANASAASAPKHPSYCFFKAANRKGWSAARDKSGNVTVKGQAKVEDIRYSAALEQGEVDGDTARVWLTMPPNSGYQDADRWWDVGATIPGSAAVKSVSVMCGAKEAATVALRQR
jgi:hypothetical protein